MPITSDEEKDSLRKRFKQLRRSMPPEKKENAEAIIQRNIILHPYYQMAPSIFLYIAKENELSTKTVCTDALAAGKQVAVPRCCGNGEMEFFPISSLDDLVPGAYGILEPKETILCPIYPEESSLCIVPGLGFDLQGYRLGYGKGYYDRYLSRFPHMHTAGLCYEENKAYQLPAEPHDRHVDVLFTEQAIYEIRK